MVRFLETWRVCACMWGESWGVRVTLARLRVFVDCVIWNDFAYRGLLDLRKNL